MMKVSVLQFEPRLLDKAYNLKRITELLSSLRTDLVVLPELCTSGYVFSTKEEVYSIAEVSGKGEAFI
ncbi:MAG TPA: nitrilase-related carbon-nitrogen hydrolase, partial [Candidatus Cloacimonas sp.]|nr:nitrilase-related carbon-nitrogen hydrolase [Candidatus Cloacimonas sp.]